MPRIGLMIWPSGPSTPPDAPPWLEDQEDAGFLYCEDCDEQFRPGQSCRCSEPATGEAS